MKLIIDLTESELAKLEEITKTSFFGAEIDAEVSDAISKLLESQPCEDCIRRDDAINAAIEAADEWDGGCNLERANMINKALEELSSVTPQPKMGRWNRVIDKAGHWVWECDKCGWQQRFNTNFCPDCGAKMAESEEV